MRFRVPRAVCRAGQTGAGHAGAAGAGEGVPAGTGVGGCRRAGAGTGRVSAEDGTAGVAERLPRFRAGAALAAVLRGHFSVVLSAAVTVTV